MDIGSFRGTGRTTRMLDVSVDAARQGEYVFVIAANEQHVGVLYHMLLKYPGSLPTNRETGKVYFNGADGVRGEVSVIAPDPDRINWSNGSVVGAYPGIRTFFDHYVLETEMGWMLPCWLEQNEAPE